jgi:hypothetical protein
MASALSPSAARSYTEQHSETAMKLLRHLATNPPSYIGAAHQALGAFFMRMSYGYIAVENDPLIEVAHQALGHFVQGFLFHFWVDDLPICE